MGHTTTKIALGRRSARVAIVIGFESICSRYRHQGIPWISKQGNSERQKKRAKELAKWVRRWEQEEEKKVEREAEKEAQRDRQWAKGDPPSQTICTPGDNPGEQEEVILGGRGAKLLWSGWWPGTGLGPRNNGIRTPITPPKGKLYDKYTIGPKPFVAPAVHPPGPRGQCKVPPPSLRQITYPFVVGLHNVKV